MNKQVEVAFNILQLLSTIEEGINYIQKQLTELRYEEAFVLLKDVVDGIASIDKTLKPMEVKIKALQDEKIKRAKENLNQYITEMVMLYKYKSKNHEELEKTLNLVINTFNVWKEEIEIIIRCKVAS
ncbi:MAG: hypothetical protein N4A62_10415 [Marinisporobacter sp.]|jgi:hypothetical protein|nr:hypothetical protein [Marinisporobacter sp.]